MENEGLMDYPGSSTLCCSSELTSKAKTQPSPEMAPSGEVPGPGTDRTTAGPYGSAAGPGTSTGLRPQQNHLSKSPGASSAARQGRLVPAEILLLYVSQTESRLLPTDELYQTGVNTVGEVMEAFLQGPERQRVQEL